VRARHHRFDGGNQSFHCDTRLLFQQVGGVKHDRGQAAGYVQGVDEVDVIEFFRRQNGTLEGGRGFGSVADMHDAAFGMLGADLFEKGGVFVRIGCGRRRRLLGAFVIVDQVLNRKRSVKMINVTHDDVHRHNLDIVLFGQISGDIRTAFSRKDHSAHVLPPSPEGKIVVAIGINLLVPIYHIFCARPKSVQMETGGGA